MIPYSVSFCFIANEYIEKNYGSGTIPSNVLRDVNPSLQSIGLRREPTVKPTEKPTEAPTKAPSNSDYSSYLGKWSYTKIPENANDIPSDHYVSTTLIIQEINGDTVKFELSKGNILTVADTIVSGIIIDGVIDFEYIDGWGSSGYGTITLNENSVHVFCVQEESNTYNSPS